MGILFAIIGFVTGLSIASGVVLLALAGTREMGYWSLVKGHPIIGRLAMLLFIAAIIACGVMFAYLGFTLEE